MTSVRETHNINEPTSAAIVSIEVIVPERAKRLMKIRSSNIRPVRWTQVVSYSETMRRGGWTFNGSSIVLDCFTGGVLDGNHRLLACIRAKTPFTAVVVYGVHPDAFTSIDIGAKRGSRDFLQIGSGRKFSFNDAALVALILTWFTQRFNSFTWSDGRFSQLKADQTVFTDAYKKFGHTIRPSTTERIFAGVRTKTSHWNFVDWYFQNFSDSDYVVYSEYCERFFDGVGLLSGHPVLHVRNTLLKGVQGSATAAAIERMRVFCLGLRLYLESPHRGYSSQTWLKRLARHRSEHPVFSDFNQLFPYPRAKQLHEEHHDFWRKYVYFPSSDAVRKTKRELGRWLNEAHLPGLAGD